MAIARLTKGGIQGLPTGTYYDADLTGFGLRIGETAATWFIEYRPGAGGRGVAKKRVKIGRLDKLAPDAARKLAARQLAQVELGSDPAQARADERAGMTFREIADAYIDRHVVTKRKPATADYYRAILNIHIAPHIGTTRATQVARADVAKMHDAVAKKRTEGRGGRYIANRALAIVSATYGWAGGAGFVPEDFNPATRIERFGEDGRERFLTTDEIVALGEAMREAETIGIAWAPSTAKHAPKENTRTVFSPHVTAAIRLLMLTGSRLREILNLRWTEVDLERGLLFLPDSKTGRKTVILSTAAAEILRDLPRVGRYVVASDSAGTKDEKPRHDIKRPWAAISKRAGLDGVRLHDLRHTFASVGAGSGLGLPVIGKLLGHANTATTARYAHLSADASRRAADLIADQIGAAIGGGRNG